MELRIDKKWGYAWVKVRNHEEFGTKWVKEHHFNWWKEYRQRVPRGWVLHHIDENKLNNAVNNLQLMTRGAHALLHSVYREFTDKTRAKMSSSALEFADRPGERESRSERAKRQHEQKNFGQHTWSEDTKKKIYEKIGLANKGRPSGMLGKKMSPEQREHYRQAAIKREAKKRGE